jgi:hypothetical protein
MSKDDQKQRAHELATIFIHTTTKPLPFLAGQPNPSFLNKKDRSSPNGTSRGKARNLVTKIIDPLHLAKVAIMLIMSTNVPTEKIVKEYFALLFGQCSLYIQ